MLEKIRLWKMVNIYIIVSEKDRNTSGGKNFIIASRKQCIVEGGEKNRITTDKKTSNDFM